MVCLIVLLEFYCTVVCFIKTVLLKFECMNDTFEMGSIVMFISMLTHNIFLETTFVILKFNNWLGVLKQMLNQKKNFVIYIDHKMTTFQTLLLKFDWLRSCSLKSPTYMYL